MSATRNDRITQRQVEAQIRAAKREELTDEEQLLKLSARGVTEGREVTRLLAKIALKS